MNKNILILLSFVGLWTSSIVSENYENILGLFLIISFGILHGSNDILLLKENVKTDFTKASQSKIIFIYVLCILVIICSFYLIPKITLLVFILISAYHFGEQHLYEKLNGTPSILKHSLHLSYGCTVLIGLLLLNIKQVHKIIFSISAFNLQSQHLIILLIISASLLISALAYCTYKKWVPIPDLIYEILIATVLFIIFNVSTLIWGFAIYFIFWHSLPSLNDQIKYVYGNTNSENVKNYVLKALPYWAVSIAGLIVFYFILKDDKLLYAILFSFIAAITFPHAFVIYKTFKHEKTLPN